MTIRKSLLVLVPAAFFGFASAADAAVVYCTQPGYPAGCVVRVVRPAATRVVVNPAPVVVAPAPVVVAPAPRYVRPRSAINLGGPVNRVGVR